ncbi:MAG: replication-relaxation family protein [Anaerolineae bacterium]
MGDIRQRRDQRPRKPTPMQLTERDKQVIEAVHLYRVLRQDQIQALFFGASKAAQRRLIRLYHHGFLERLFLPVVAGRSPTFYVLDRKGAELLRSELGYDELHWYNSSKDLKTDFLEHTIAINDFRIAVTHAAQQEGYRLVIWKSESDLKASYDRVAVRVPSGKAHNYPIVPDSYFVIETPLGRAHFFIEVDRGTETTDRFKSKIRAYTAYYETGGYEKRFQTKSLRVLTIAIGEKRLLNLKKATEDVNGRRRYWFALASDLTLETVLAAPVWQIAGETTRRPLIETV